MRSNLLFGSMHIQKSKLIEEKHEPSISFKRVGTSWRRRNLFTKEYDGEMSTIMKRKLRTEWKFFFLLLSSLVHSNEPSAICIDDVCFSQTEKVNVSRTNPHMQKKKQLFVIFDEWYINWQSFCIYVHLLHWSICFLQLSNWYISPGEDLHLLKYRGEEMWALLAIVSNHIRIMK